MQCVHPRAVCHIYVTTLNKFEPVHAGVNLLHPAHKASRNVKVARQANAGEQTAVARAAGGHDCMRLCTASESNFIYSLAKLVCMAKMRL